MPGGLDDFLLSNHFFCESIGFLSQKIPPVIPSTNANFLSYVVTRTENQSVKKNVQHGKPALC